MVEFRKLTQKEFDKMNNDTLENLKYIMECVKESHPVVSAAAADQEFPDTKELAIPYVSQLGKDADKFKNDCGAACGCMVARAFWPELDLTPDEFYLMTDKKKDVYLRVDEIQKVLLKFHRISTYFRVGQNKIKQWLEQERAVIVLVNYGPIQDWEKNPRSNFRDMHYVVVCGYGPGYYTILDPLHKLDIDHAGRRVPVGVFMDAWNTAQPGMGAIVTDAKIGTVMKEIEAWEVIADYGLNIRDKPDISGVVVGGIPQGKIIQIIKKTYFGDTQELWGKIGDNKWIAIEYDGTMLAKEII